MGGDTARRGGSVGRHFRVLLSGQSYLRDLTVGTCGIENPRKHLMLCVSIGVDLALSALCRAASWGCLVQFIVWQVMSAFPCL